VAIPKASEYIYMLIYSDVISNAVYLYCSGWRIIDWGKDSFSLESECNAVERFRITP
jgi:hypothetical protein